MNQLNAIQQFIVILLPLIFAITVHEVAHGWVALKFGDRTAQMLGRLTLNPIKHIDPLGTVILPLALYFLGGFVFGWAKPVPVTSQNLRNPKRDMIWVALAGPGANLLMALFWAMIVKLGQYLLPALPMPGIALIYMGIAGIFINIGLMVLNLLPIPPLDGSKIVGNLLPKELAYSYYRIEPYGFLILIVLLASGVLFKIIIAPLFILVQLIMHFFQIPPALLLNFLNIQT